MAGLMQQLIGVLEEQTGYYSQLCELSAEKNEVIIVNDVQSLQKITSLENIIIGRLQRLDKNRLSIMKDIAMVLNRDENDLTLGKLAELIAGQPEHDTLVSVTERIRSAAHSLKSINDQNRILIDSSLEYIDFSVNVMRSAMDSGPSLYSPTGESIDGSKSFFDAKK
jgi:flagellar biosynthesis/type III secretory pathway chaperone